MHLTDEQLLELDQSGHLHIEQCESCRQRASNLNDMRRAFQTMPDITLPPGGWQKIQKIQVERQQFTDLKRTRQQLTRWKIGSLALAASFLAVMFWPLAQSPSISHPVTNQQVSLLIQQNKRLQLLLDDASQKDSQTKVSYQLLQLDLQSVDQTIQRAYLQGANNDVKSELWEKRKQLVNQLLSRTGRIQPLRI